MYEQHDKQQIIGMYYVINIFNLTVNNENRLIWKEYLYLSRKAKHCSGDLFT